MNPVPIGSRNLPPELTRFPRGNHNAPPQVEGRASACANPVDVGDAEKRTETFQLRKLEDVSVPLRW